MLQFGLKLEAPSMSVKRQHVISFHDDKLVLLTPRSQENIIQIDPLLNSKMLASVKRSSGMGINRRSVVIDADWVLGLLLADSYANVQILTA